MAPGRCDVLRRGDDFDYYKKTSGNCSDRDRVLKIGQTHVHIPSNGDAHRQGKVKDRVNIAAEVGFGGGYGGKSVNEEQLSRGRKRKFSPIVWDQEESRNKNVTGVTTTLSPSPLRKVPGEIPKIRTDAGVRLYPVAADKLQVSLGSSAESCVSNGSVGSVGFEDDFPPLVVPKESFGSKKSVPELFEHDGFDKGYNISSSRWASQDDSFGGIDHSDGLMADRQDTAFGVHSSSPESGEFLKEGSAGDRAELSGSDDVSCLSGSARGGYESGNDDAMDIDNCHLEFDSDDDVHGVQHSKAEARANMLQSCRSVFDYERMNKISEGTYGVVYRARDKKTGEIVALKKVKMGRQAEREGFPLTALREMNILLSFDHPSIVAVKEVVADEGDGIFMVMEYMEHDLKGLMDKMKQPFSTSEVKCLMKQLLEGVKYLHDNWVIHRDLKTSNLLSNNVGEMKICDFGLSRQYGYPLKPYTSLVVTLWYRAPELLLGQKQYSTAIDMWSVGCIMAELLAKKPLFQGESEIDQLGKIFKILGSPNETSWPGFSKLPGAKATFAKHKYNGLNTLRKLFPAASFTGSSVLSDSGFDLLSRLLTFDPEMRITAEDALNHNWFHEVPLPKSKEFMPSVPVQQSQGMYKDLQVLIRGEFLEEGAAKRMSFDWLVQSIS